jgi:uncharacterized protein YbaR (Trm112 family)
MISVELLSILRCPETLQPLRLAPDEVLARVAQERLRDRSGNPVALPLEGGLLRQDGAVLYPIRSGIPVMLIDEAIPLGQAEKPDGA